MAYTDIDKPSDYFNTKLYTGTGSSTSITGVGFQPDLVYTTSRSNSYNNGMFDSVRGVNKLLNSNTTNAEASISNGISSFDSDGFTFSGDAYNTNNYTFVSWNWLAGGTASSNTDGSITSSVSASTTSGFSIVSYTGNGSANQTAGHGLGVTPKIKIIKNRDNTPNWTVTSSILGTDKRMFLNLTNAVGTTTGYYPDDTSSTIGLSGSNSGTGQNTSGEKYIAYCFAEKQGFSKIGSYTGNGNADGTFIYTGFRPAFVMVKSTGSGGWLINDTKRSPHNITGLTLYADSNASEESYTIGASEWDFLSNGFKNRDAGSAQNTSGTSYIYMAFAESPFVTGASAIPTTAR